MIFLNGMVQGDLIERDPNAPIVIRCITLWEPWATWVMWGWKTIETRTHTRFKSLVGECIGIHSGRTWDRDAIAMARPYLSTEQIRETVAFFDEFRRGVHPSAVIAVARAGSHRLLTAEDSPRALIECNTTRFGLDFGSDVERVQKPYPVKGARGIWKTTLRFV